MPNDGAGSCYLDKDRVVCLIFKDQDRDTENAKITESNGLDIKDNFCALCGLCVSVLDFDRLSGYHF